MNHKVLFIAGLSNGETITEEKGNFQTIPGELSPWQRLLRYIGERGVKITSLSLYTKDGQRWNLPSAGKNPKFHAFADLEQPVSLRMFRKVARDQDKNWEAPYTCAEAIYKDGHSLQIWVDNETQNSWCILTNNNK